MRAVLFLTIVAVVGLVAYVLATLIPASGVLADLEPMLIEECRRVEVAPGTEDVTVDPETNTAFVSASDRRARLAGKPGPGAIYALRLDGSDRVMRISPANLDDFHPHGISLWTGENGMKRLFVINHSRGEGPRVEIFDVGFGGALLHVASVAFEEMHSPNDVVGVGPRRFYATNDHGFEEGPLAALETWLALPLSSVAYFDGQSGSIAAKGLVYANGINASADESTIYVAETLRRRIAAFSRDPETGALSLEKRIPVNTAPDNIEVASDGALWVAGHSKIFAFLEHAENPSAIAPSHVIRVDPRTGVREDVLIDTSGVINGSSAAAVSDDSLIVGAVFDSHVMVCPLGR